MYRCSFVLLSTPHKAKKLNSPCVRLLLAIPRLQTHLAPSACRAMARPGWPYCLFTFNGLNASPFPCYAWPNSFRCLHCVDCVFWLSLCPGRRYLMWAEFLGLAPNVQTSALFVFRNFTLVSSALGCVDLVFESIWLLHLRPLEKPGCGHCLSHKASTTCAHFFVSVLSILATSWFFSEFLGTMLFPAPSSLWFVIVHLYSNHKCSAHSTITHSTCMSASSVC